MTIGSIPIFINLHLKADFWLESVQSFSSAKCFGFSSQQREIQKLSVIHIFSLITFWMILAQNPCKLNFKLCYPFHPPSVSNLTLNKEKFKANLCHALVFPLVWHDDIGQNDCLQKKLWMLIKCVSKQHEIDKQHKNLVDILRFLSLSSSLHNRLSADDWHKSDAATNCAT